MMSFVWSENFNGRNHLIGSIKVNLREIGLKEVEGFNWLGIGSNSELF
jgi:hypothetical protein